MTIKKHKRREIGDWKSKVVTTYFAHIYTAGNYELTEAACRKACFPSGLCVTIERVKYLFGGGSEDGVRVGLIQYPPFLEEESLILEKAVALGKQIIEDNHQFSFTVVTPTETHFFSRVK